MTKKDFPQELLEEAERIEREEIGAPDEEADGRWIFVRARPPREPSQIYSIRLPVSAIEQLRSVALTESEAPTALLREWVLERLDTELKMKEKAPSSAASPGRRTSSVSGQKPAGRQKRGSRRGSKDGAVKPSRSSPRPASPLTRREREVLAFLTEGTDSETIAQALRITPETVRDHLKNVLAKLG
jgi:DNA-binding CsgD family transcriptional regulator